MQKFLYKARKKTEKYENEKKPLRVREIFTSVSSNEGLVWLHVLNTLWLVNKTCYSPSTKPMQDWNWLRLGHSFFLNLFSVMVFILSSHFLLHIMSTFVTTDQCDYYLSIPVFLTVILLLSLPSCLARHSPELWRPEHNRQAASAVVANLSDWSNPASCRVDEFQTHQPLSLGHSLGYTLQAVKKNTVIST